MHARKVHRIALVATAAAIVGCGAASQEFRPASHVTGETVTGHPAAEYDIETPQGEMADVRLWSRGAWETEVRGQDETVVHVGLSIDNHRDAPIELDTSRLRADVLVEDHRYQDVGPLSVNGATTIAPGATTELDAYFAVPRGIDPDDIKAFRVHWAIRGPDRTYAQVTPFLPRPEPPPYPVGFYYSPFYDPFYAPYGPPYPGVVVQPGPYYHRYWMY